MKERPILFSSEMIYAIQAGVKTQTRRVYNVNRPDSPYGNSGDLLWVRETWAEHEAKSGRIYYKADNELGDWVNRKNDKWRPSIFMPRKYSRISLIVKNVRRERLQDITESDAKAEGWNWDKLLYTTFADSARVWYRELWEEINGKGSWDKNPLVWVIEFEVLA